MEGASIHPMKVKANMFVEVDCRLFSGDMAEFCNNWIIVRQVDESDGVTTGVFYHIRKRTEDDPAGTAMINSL